ncbi:hypothetical protein ABL78_0284 [Leptomonas seymouri]|uniref:Uncharacterized protein n=1 Tax=Leptomonas seymouri TaxID=5684 RepID=A0A0N1IMJ9_LEPSE|nr:hypothetical protein ABL78_0284 [Leptomonas seymouri]|eukprot:KPI90524.1 hypothetical protein ABL78_0284 [Leptomonas seymouri]
MNETKKRPLRLTAAPSQPHHHRPLTSFGTCLRVSSTDNSDRHVSVAVPRGSSLSFSGDPTCSSSITISSDTSSESLEASTPAFSGRTVTVAPASAAAATATTTASDGRQSPLWWDASLCLSAEGPGADTGAAIAAVVAGEPSASTALLHEWRCSIDFSHAIETRAEAELQQLWTTLWCATHSEAALAAALKGPRTQWNPYRPVRGGHEAREEVLNSEVVEFSEMIAADSLYLRGTAVKPEMSVAHSAVTAATSPHRPPQKLKGVCVPLQIREKHGEEVFIVDNSGVDHHPPRPQALAASAGESAEVDAHYTEAWWSAHRASGAAALFQYLWEAVVVPFYTSTSTISIRSLSSSQGLRATAAPTSPAPIRTDDGDEKDVSGVVTSFWPAREDRHNWEMELGLPSSPPLYAGTPLSVRDGEGEQRLSLLTLTQRSGGGLSLHPTADLDVASDDSLEVEVLDDTDGQKCELASGEAPFPGKTSRGQRHGTASRLQSAKRNPRRRDRPSTAGIHSSALSPIKDIPLRMPIPVSRHGGALAAKQRARSARTDDAENSLSVAHPTQPNDSSRLWRWTRTPTPRTSAVESLADITTDVQLLHTGSPTRRRPPAAQPLMNRSGRLTSPSSLSQAVVTNTARVHASNGDDGASHNATATTATAAVKKTPPVASAAESRTGPYSPVQKASVSNNAFRAQRQPRQLNNSASGAVGHALELLSLRDRSTSHSPLAQCDSSPFARPPPIDAPRKGVRRGSSVAEESCEGADVKGCRPNGRLSPMAVASPQEKRRRHAHRHPRSDNNKAGPLVAQAEEEKAALPEYGLDGTGKLVSAAKSGPLQETAARSARPQGRLTDVPEAHRGASALGRTSFAKPRRQGKGEVQRSSSPERKKTVR